MKRERRVGAWLGVLALLLTGCLPTQEAKRDGIAAVNKAFQVEYEAALEKNGTRVVIASPDVAFDAVNAALVKLGLVVHEQSRSLGVISAEGPSPLPLDRSEWDRASAADLPKTRELLWRHLGPMAEFFNFDTNGLDTVMTATISGVADGSAISLTMRMREVAPPKSDLPRRDYPPPTPVQVGLDKTWSVVDQELAARKKRN
jgi:hypothetical protein